MSNTTAAAKSPPPHDEQIAVRLPAHLVERVDAYRSQLAKAAPGIGVTRSDAVRALLLVALDHHERA